MKVSFDRATGEPIYAHTKPDLHKLQSAIGVLANLAKIDGPLKDAACRAKQGVSDVLALLRGEVVEGPKE